MKLFGRNGDQTRESPAVRKFDLNIEEVLEGWKAQHAVREFISNALDEQALTGTPDMEVRQVGRKKFTILDWGRGLRPEHLTQNEDAEKMSGAAPVIGRFGVGLKDALAVLSRLGVDVRIRSRHCTISTGPAKKHGFESITTLHALVGPPDDPRMPGTEVMLNGITRREIDEAKSLFRRFSGETALESTRYGDILDKARGEPGRIYVNGVRVAEEDNFLFSYDITSLTTAMKRALNRERSNVGRAAYAGRVKSILMAATSHGVTIRLATDVGRHEVGSQHDETKWSDVSVRACKLLNASGNVVFATADQQRRDADAMDDAAHDGMRVITIPDRIGGKLAGATDETGSPVRDLRHYVAELDARFEFKYVEPADLTGPEKIIWGKTIPILKLVGAQNLAYGVRISETMRPGNLDVDGIWDGDHITLRRSVLTSLDRYAGVLLHEAAHALSGSVDVTRQFELELTRLLGRIAAQAVEGSGSPSHTWDR